MKQNSWKLVVVVALVVAVGVVFAVKNQGGDEDAVTLAESTLTADSTETMGEYNRPESDDCCPGHDTAHDESSEAEEVTRELTVAAAPANEQARVAAAADNPRVAETALPQLIQLGADQCMPCRMMKPIIEELQRDYKGKLEVVFIDVWKDRAAGEKYGVQSIPTQVFVDGNGKEFSRNVGFFPKDDILKTFRNQGIKLD